MFDSTENRKRQNREFMRKWREAHPEAAREETRRRREAHPEKTQESSRKWREAHPDKKQEANRKWREENPDKNREAARKWREANPKKVKEQNEKARLRRIAAKEAAIADSNRIAAERRETALAAQRLAADEHMARELAAMHERNGKIRRNDNRTSREAEVVIYGRRWWPRPINSYFECDWQMLRAAYLFFDDYRRNTRHENSRKSQAILIRNQLRTMNKYMEGQSKAFLAIVTQLVNDYGNSSEDQDIDNRPPETLGVCHD